MVIQQGKPFHILGKAPPAEEVKIEFRSRQWKVTSDKNGKWETTLESLTPGGPDNLTLSTRFSSLTVHDVLVGEVWVCGGQSNMTFHLSELGPQSAAEIANSNHPLLHIYSVPSVIADQPQEEVAGTWQVSKPENAGPFSAVCYFYGRDLQEKLGIPVGMIQSSWGGTSAEAWTTRESLDSSEETRPIMDRWRAGEFHKEHQEWQPAVLFNGMISPLTWYPLRGVAWYQGESNAWRAFQYQTSLPLLIQDWRKAWSKALGGDELHFQVVQLANFGAPVPEPSGTSWAELREAQSMAADSLPGVDLTVTIDIGEADNIHPKNKQEVGRRLMLGALKSVYKKDVVSSGPKFKSVSLRNGEIEVSFEPLSPALATRDGQAPRGFAVAGADQKFYWATAVIHEDHKLSVSSPDVPNPVAVRYGWADNPDCNLTNTAGLPASPFRTDDWLATTFGRH